MVKLTTKYLFRKISKRDQLQPRKKNETDLDYLKRITHLQLQSQFIDKISSVPECQSVVVLYLQNNLLRTTHNIESFPNLTHLYLQHNFISKIENLNQLTSLRKLYLGYNEISVVEGLDKLENLTELHIEGQRLPQGETVYFDPLTLAQLRLSLKVLNVSNNNMTSMQCLSSLTSLTRLIIENNQIKELQEVMETLAQLPMLETFNAEGNPVVSHRRFLNTVILSSNSVKNLNGKGIDEGTRLFIKNMARSSQCRRRISEFSTRVFNSNESFPGLQKPTNLSINKIDSKTSALLGSKLFPVLKSVVDTRQKSLRTPMASSKDVSEVFKVSLNVSRLSGSAS